MNKRQGNPTTLTNRASEVSSDNGSEFEREDFLIRHNQPQQSSRKGLHSQLKTTHPISADLDMPTQVRGFLSDLEQVVEGNELPIAREADFKTRLFLEMPSEMSSSESFAKDSAKPVSRKIRDVGLEVAEESKLPDSEEGLSSGSEVGKSILMGLLTKKNQEGGVALKDPLMATISTKPKSQPQFKSLMYRRFACGLGKRVLKIVESLPGRALPSNRDIKLSTPERVLPKFHVSRDYSSISSLKGGAPAEISPVKKIAFRSWAVECNPLSESESEEFFERKAQAFAQEKKPYEVSKPPHKDLPVRADKLKVVHLKKEPVEVFGLSSSDDDLRFEIIEPNKKKGKISQLSTTGSKHSLNDDKPKSGGDLAMVNLPKLHGVARLKSQQPDKIMQGVCSSALPGTVQLSCPSSNQACPSPVEFTSSSLIYEAIMKEIACLDLSNEMREVQSTETQLGCWACFISCFCCATEELTEEQRLFTRTVQALGKLQLNKADPLHQRMFNALWQLTGHPQENVQIEGEHWKSIGFTSGPIAELGESGFLTVTLLLYLCAKFPKLTQQTLAVSLAPGTAFSWVVLGSRIASACLASLKQGALNSTLNSYVKVRSLYSTLFCAAFFHCFRLYTKNSSSGIEPCINATCKEIKGKSERLMEGLREHIDEEYR